MQYQPKHNPHKSAIARSFSRAASTYDQVAVLQREIGHRLLERLELIKLDPNYILDLGGGTGFFSRALNVHYPKANIINSDIAEGMVAFAQKLDARSNTLQSFVCADGEYLPFQNQTMDFVFSNCTLQWFLSPEMVLQEIYRILKPNGLLLFSTFGPDTLKELRSSFAKLDAFNHVNTFIDMHTIGDLLLHLGFQDPVMDMEMITLTYQNINGLLRDLKLMGAQHVNTSDRRGLSTKKNFDKLSNCYEAYRNEEDVLPATFEIVYGLAWMPETIVQPTLCTKANTRIPITQI